MIIIVFTAAILILSAMFGIALQYQLGNTFLIFAYAASMLVCGAIYCICERIQRKKIISRLSGLFNGEYHGIINEDEMSGLERQVMLRIRSEETREDKITESYKNIASLVSDISHQCKTPLSSVIMYTDMLPDGETVSAIKVQTEKLRFLLEALTKLSKCESGLIAENLHSEENDVRELICHAVTDVYAAAESKNIEIISNISSDITARFDMRWTTEAILNVLDNAVKYSLNGSEVRIIVHRYDMFIRIDISDSGCGMPDEDICNIWKRFYRGKNVADISNGIGIGLYLCSMILTSEGGHISVKSQIGIGSTFSVFLPR